MLTLWYREQLHDTWCVIYSMYNALRIQDMWRDLRDNMIRIDHVKDNLYQGIPNLEWGGKIIRDRRDSIKELKRISWMLVRRLSRAMNYELTGEVQPTSVKAIMFGDNYIRWKYYLGCARYAHMPHSNIAVDWTDCEFHRLADYAECETPWQGDHHLKWIIEVSPLHKID